MRDIDLTDVEGYRVARLLTTPALRFAPVSSATAPFVALPQLPPAVCWTRSHTAPHPDCSCGYHGFASLLDARDYLEIFTTRVHLNPYRCVVACQVASPLWNNEQFRAYRVDHTAILLPPQCPCRRPTQGVAARRECVDLADQASRYATVSAACAVHMDRDLTHRVENFLPTAVLLARTSKKIEMRPLSPPR